MKIIKKNFTNKISFKFRTILTIILISSISIEITNCSNSKNLLKMTFNGGDWDNGFKCPKFLLVSGSKNHVDQGGVLIRPKELMENTGDDKKGFVIEFENLPVTSSLIYKIGTQINSSKKFYIPWRYFKPDMSYNNPYFNNKTIKGTLYTDDKNTYSYIIKLPYKLLGYYISDGQGEKIKDKMYKLSYDVQNNIKKAKANLSKYSNEFFRAKEDIKEIEKSNKDLNKLKENLKQNEDNLQKECDKNTELKKKVDEAKLKKDQITQQLLIAQNQLDNVTKKLNDNNNRIDILKKSIENYKQVTDHSKLIDENQQNANSALIDAEKEYNILKQNAPDKISDIEKSHTGLKALNRDEYQNNLNKISP